MMPHYRGMSRGLCTVVGSHGVGMGHLTYLVRFSPEAGAAESLSDWLLRAIPDLPAKRGIGSAHLLQGTAIAPMTSEQRIRGADSGVDFALLVMGYEADALSELARDVLGPDQLERRGATAAVAGQYRLDYTLIHAEVDA
jgi:hypothetical protein